MVLYCFTWLSRNDLFYLDDIVALSPAADLRGRCPRERHLLLNHVGLKLEKCHFGGNKLSFESLHVELAGVSRWPSTRPFLNPGSCVNASVPLDDFAGKTAQLLKC